MNGPRTADQDIAFMRRALDLAGNGIGLASPNPLVGAVVVKEGSVVGEGWHEGPGTPHAETVALAAAGERARGASLYVTLEPCSHTGRTPPCAQAVVRAGVRRVVAAIQDPDRHVDGRGFEMLRAGHVEVTTGVLAAEAEERNAGFLKVARGGMPFVTLKLAASLDGKVAARDGSSRWITGEAARRDAHRLRAEADAVLVGAGTAVEDDPSLTVRLDGYRGRQPLRVVVDSSGRVPPIGHLFDGSAPTLMATTAEAPAEARDGWAAAGAHVMVSAERGRVRLERVLEDLSRCRPWQVRSVLIEGGPTLAWSAVADGLVDRVVLYLAPKLVGGAAAPGILGGEGVATLADASSLRFRSVERIGADVKLVAEPSTVVD
jgi:diaminohydroxyphosphoribosylaminopyrimidine deaminase/5-amino-6-(5-phosphoribosylamino)uracil reductase